MSNEEGDFQQTMHLTWVCLKASQELLFNPEFTAEKGRNQQLQPLSAFLFQFAPASEG